MFKLTFSWIRTSVSFLLYSVLPLDEYYRVPQYRARTDILLCILDTQAPLKRSLYPIELNVELVICRFELCLSFYYGFLPLEENVIMSDLRGSSEFNGLLVNSFFRLASTYEFNPWIVKILKIYLIIQHNLSITPYKMLTGSLNRVSDKAQITVITLLLHML